MLYCTREHITDLLLADYVQTVEGLNPGIVDRTIAAVSGEVENVLCARVYHVNVVTQYITYDAEGDQQVRFERVRLILDREGIKRLEEVPVA